MLDQEAFEKEINPAIDAMVEGSKGEEQTSEEVTPETTPNAESSREETPPVEKPSDGGEYADTETAEGEPNVEKQVEAGDEKKVEEPKKVEISIGALVQAARFGIPVEDARAFPSEDALLRAVSIIEKASQQREEPKAAKKQEEDVDPLAALPKLDPKVYEPEVIEMFDKLTGVVREQQKAIKEFRSHQETVVRSSQEATAKEIEQWFDKQVEGLGDDFADALGKGGYSSLNRGSSQFATRDKIASQMAVLMAGYKASGQPTPPRDEVFSAASRLVLGDEYRKISERKLTADLEKQATQHIQRAGSSKGKVAQSPVDETVALINERFFAK